MLISRIRSHATLTVVVPACLVVALLCLSACSSALAAGSPAAVTVRVEGQAETKLPLTQITTTTAPVVNDGNSEHACPGTSALGALQIATAGNWSGPWEATYNQYSIYMIEGEKHEFESKASANYYWSFWLNDKESEVGACEAQLQPGDNVLFFPACYGAACPVSPTPLAIEAPAAADVDETVNVAVKQYNSKGEASPASGARVVGGGAGAITDSQGHAALRFSGGGTYTLLVSGDPSGAPAVRTEATICVHNGNDGTCGATAPTAPKSEPPIVKPPAPVVLADVPSVGGVKNGARYRRGRGPRILRGAVQVPEGGTLRDVRISLQRRHGRHCQVFSGTRAVFVRARCGVARFFSVGASESFSYLLSKALPAGRYVYEVEAVNDAGTKTVPVSGVSRVAFYVK